MVYLKPRQHTHSPVMCSILSRSISPMIVTSDNCCRYFRSKNDATIFSLFFFTDM